MREGSWDLIRVRSFLGLTDAADDASHVVHIVFPFWAMQDHLGWTYAHVVGFSMGGMIATKLAARHPERVRSLLLLGVTAGGWQVRAQVLRQVQGTI